MANLENWVHYNQSILNAGRTTYLETDPPEGMDISPEDYMKIVESKDPTEKRLKSISEDSKIKGNHPAWVLRYCGDKTSY